MKRFIRILLLMLILIVTNLTGCYNISKETHKTDNNLIICKEHNDVNIIVNRNIELISVIAYLSDYSKWSREMIELDTTYKSDVEEYFSKYKKHKVVKLFDKLSLAGLSYHTVPELMLYYNSQFNQIGDIKFNEELIDIIGGKELLDKFINQIKEFYTVTEFQQFYDDHQDFYKSIIDETIEVLGNQNFVKELQDFYGIEQNSYNIVLGSLFNGGGYGPRVKVENNKYDIYSIIGPQSTNDKGQTIFGTFDSLKHLQRHEFSHSFVNYLTEEVYDDLVNRYSSLFNPIKEVMTSMAYGTWDSCLNEHIVEAVTTKMTIRDNKIVGEDNLNIQLYIKKFIYIEHIINKLDKYQNNRDKYKTFKDFYPEILKSLNKFIDNPDLINKALRFNVYDVINQGNLLIVIPTDESTKNSDIEEYAKIKNKYYQGKVVTDQEALQMDISKYNVMIYGTIEGNKLLSKYKKSLPFQINNHIVKIKDNEYKGDKIQLLSLAKNPEASEKYFIIITSNHEDYINARNNLKIFYAYHLYIDNREITKGFYDNIKK